MNPHLAYSPRDWPEDFADEDNGCYYHVCYTCGGSFMGHKRRVNICHVCADEDRARFHALSPEDQAAELAHNEAAIIALLNTAPFRCPPNNPPSDAPKPAPSSV